MSRPTEVPDLLGEVLQELADDLLVIDGGGTVLQALPRTSERYGRAGRPLVGSDIREILTPESADELLAAAHGAAHTHGWVSLELRFLAPGGEPGTLAVAVSRLGATDRVMVVGENLRMFEQRLRQIRSVLFAIPDRIVLVDPRYRVLLSNHPRGNDVGRRCHSFYYGREEPCADCPVSAVLRKGRPASDRQRSGHRTLVRHAYPVLREDGTVEAVVELVRDVTQEERVREQLVRADKMASLGQLTAGVAHEINNPTQFIRENVRILQEMIRDVMPILEGRWRDDPDLRIARLPFPYFREQVPVLAQDIETGASRIRDIVASLKQFARKDEGLLDEDVDIAAAIASSLRLTHNQVKNVARVTLDVAPAMPTVRGNAQKIDQVLVNVILNAVDAIREARRNTEAREDAGEIRISASFDRGARRIQIVVADNGTGIRPEVLRQVFDPFFTTKQGAGGTGLGLSIAHGIIDEHGGAIEADSVVGKGTEFRISLPAGGREARHG